MDYQFPLFLFKNYLLALWPGLLVFFFGVVGLLYFKFYLKKRSFKILFYIFSPSYSLLVAGIVGVGAGYLNFERSVSDIRNLSQLELTASNGVLVNHLQSGRYLEFSEFLSNFKSTRSLLAVRAFLLPDMEPLLEVGDWDNEYLEIENFIVSSADIDGSNVSWAKIEFAVDHEKVIDKATDHASQIGGIMFGVLSGFFLFIMTLSVFFSRKLGRASEFISGLHLKVSESSSYDELLENLQHLKYSKASLEEERLLEKNLTTLVSEMAKLREKWVSHQTEIEIGKIAMQVGHDIRSPLATIKVVLASAEKVLGPEQLTLVYSALARVSKISDTLLDRGSKNDLITKKQVHISKVIEQIVSEQKVLVKTSGKSIDFKLNLEVDVLLGLDLTEVGRVFSNIINNSVEAISNSGFISVSWFIEKEYFVFEVVDSGCGIDSRQLEKIGQRGFSSKKGELGGNGFGVYHAKSFILSIGGNFWINSELGKGTSVRMFFPASLAD